MAIALGVVVGRTVSAPLLAATMVVVALGVAFVALSLGLASASADPGRRRDGWLVGALWLVLFARGLDHGAARPAIVREGHRGEVAGLRDLEVVAASMPGPRCRVMARIVGHDARWWLSLPAERCPLAKGDRLRVPADRLVLLSGPARPGSPDPRETARAHGGDGAALAREAWLAPADAPASGPWWERWSARGSAFVARQRQRAWEHGRTDDGRALVVATVLGQRSALAPERRVELRAAGLGHLIAVSGLHVALAAWLSLVVLVRVGSILGGGLAPGVLAAVGCIAGYVIVTGAAASAIRAGMMAAIVALGMLVGRPHHGLTALVAACGVMAALRPAFVTDPGFQMSAAAMAGLVGAPPGASAMSLTWRVTWAIAPVSLLHFGTVAVWGLVANLVAIPVVSAWVLPLGLAGWWLSAFVGPGAWEPAALGARLVLDLAAGLSHLPAVPIAAVAAVAARAVLGHRPARRVPGWPPLAFSLATLGAALVVAWPRAPTDLSWVADGSPRRMTLISIVAEPDGARACVKLPYGDPFAQLRTLEALGVDALGTISPPDDPAAVALEHAATREGLAIRAGDCPEPPRADARAALRACSRVGTSGPIGRAFVAVSTTGERRCFVAGRWSLLDSGPTDG